LSSFRDYALEARSYALWVGFLAVSAIFWQRVGDKRFAVPLLALSLALATSCHYLGVVAILPFAAAELVRTLLWRLIRWDVWATYVLATTPFFVGLPILTAVNKVFGGNFWSPSEWSSAIFTYSAYMDVNWKLMAVLLFTFGFLVGDLMLEALFRARETSVTHYSKLPQIALVSGFLFYPAILVVFTRLLGSGYAGRYGWPAILGITLGSVFLFRHRKVYSIHFLSALLVAYSLQVCLDIRLLSKSLSVGSFGAKDRWAKLAAVSHKYPAIPVVIGTGIQYLPAVEYSAPELRARLTQVVNSDMARRIIGSDTVDREAVLLSQYIPLRVEQLESFESRNRLFLLYSGGDFDWITQDLLESGYSLKLLSRDRDSWLYLVEKTD
jgi:hypothetical protein